jgi:hypothetical protein
MASSDDDSLDIGGSDDETAISSSGIPSLHLASASHTIQSRPPNNRKQFELFSDSYNNLVEEIDKSSKEYKQHKQSHPFSENDEKRLRAIDDTLAGYQHQQPGASAALKIEGFASETQKQLNDLKNPGGAQQVIHDPLVVHQLYQVFQENKKLLKENKQLDESLLKHQPSNPSEELSDRMHRIAVENQQLQQQNLELDNRLKALKQEPVSVAAAKRRFVTDSLS